MLGKLKNVNLTLDQLKAELIEYGAKKRNLKAALIMSEELMLLYGESFPEDAEISCEVIRDTREFAIRFSITGEEVSPEQLQKEQSVYILNNVAKPMGYVISHHYLHGKNEVKIRLERYYPFRENLKLTFRYLGSAKKHLFGGFAIHMLSIFINILPPYFTGRMIENYTNDAIEKVVITALMIMLARFLYSICFKLFADRYNECTFMMRENLSSDMLENMFRVSDSVFDSMGSGPFNKRVLGDTETIAQSLPGFSDKISEIVYYIGILVITLTINPVIFATEVLFFLILFFLEKRRTALYYLDKKKYAEADDVRYGMVIDTINGAQEIKMLGGNTILVEKVKEAQIDTDHKERVALLNSSRRKMLNDIVTAIFYSGIMIYMGYATHGGILTITECLVLFNYFTDIGMPMVKLFQSLMEQINSFSLSCERIVDLCTGSAFAKDSFGEKHLDHLTGEIRFNNVSFSYQHEDPTEEDIFVLRNVNLLIPACSNTSIIGKSGSGKSTMLKLIAGSRRISSGELLLDGVDIREYDEETIRKNITIVNQKPYFFNMSILDNLRIVNQHASMDEIREACRRSLILEDIERNPEGFNLMLGERASRLSGGQLQRLAIARALLKNSKIILLDEATSAIDNVTQGKIIEALEELKKDHTIVMVAHRLTTIRDADKICMLENHAITAEGTHSELMETSEVYRNMYRNRN